MLLFEINVYFSIFHVEKIHVSVIRKNSNPIFLNACNTSITCAKQRMKIRHADIKACSWYDNEFDNAQGFFILLFST